MKVENKVIVVTGGGNGIGRELVLHLLARGAKVAAVDIDQAALQATVDLAGDKKANLSTHIVNITDKEAVEALPEQVIAQHGAVDGIINNAGIIQPFVKLNELEYPAIERVMNINFYGTLYMTKTFLPHLLKRPAAHITNISSMGGFRPGARANGIRRIQSRGEAPDRRLELRAAEHQCAGHGGIPRRNQNEYHRQLRFGGTASLRTGAEQNKNAAA